MTVVGTGAVVDVVVLPVVADEGAGGPGVPTAQQ
jgi:hypothetical protein